MTVARLPARGETQDGVTYAQAMEAFERYFAASQAVPTIAVEMGIPFDAACRVLDGKAWPAARQYWLDKVLP